MNECRIGAGLRCKSCHACAAEEIEDHVPWLGVMQHEPGNSTIRYFCMIGVNIVKMLSLAFSNV